MKTGFQSLLLTKNLWTYKTSLGRGLWLAQKSRKVIDIRDRYDIVRVFSTCSSASKDQPLAAIRKSFHSPAGAGLCPLSVRMALHKKIENLSISCIRASSELQQLVGPTDFLCKAIESRQLPTGHALSRHVM
jgi:hypothetical protein